MMLGQGTNIHQKEIQQLLHHECPRSVCVSTFVYIVYNGKFSVLADDVFEKKYGAK